MTPQQVLVTVTDGVRSHIAAWTTVRDKRVRATGRVERRGCAQPAWLVCVGSESLLQEARLRHATVLSELDQGVTFLTSSCVVR